MTGAELRERIRRLGLTYVAAAPRLGLSLAGLHHNLRDERKITRQTEIILDYLERDGPLLNADRRGGRARRAAGSARPRPRPSDSAQPRE